MPTKREGSRQGSLLLADLVSCWLVRGKLNKRKRIEKRRKRGKGEVGKKLRMEEERRDEEGERELRQMPPYLSLMNNMTYT